ncbi:PREDICTED: uncharacterized protein LOC105567830 [Vollenhovia emeryi]|uniref:uncharacterized protein LOC105567830 n=1 Tax=Vollenhovia emeryi TaxID=411798 RepID=UPI0005F45D10|nr:PREDICTED: uncharacterized protein LOC105567830 [Vollenhovia emeryi]
MNQHFVHVYETGKMLLYALSILGIIIFELFSAAESNLPITTCKRDVVDYSACLKRALEEAWPRFLKGLPEYDFPSLDPLFYKYGKYILTSGEVRGTLIVFNTTCTGLSQMHFSDIRTHYNDDVFRLEIDTQVPYLFAEGSFNINGSLSVFKFLTQSYFNLTIHDARTTWDLTGHLVNDTWIVEHFHATPSIGKMKFYADNLIESSKQLTVTFCKRNVVDYSTCLKRALEEAWRRFIKGLPEYDLPPLDPLFYNYGKAVFNSGALRGDVRFFNLTCIGLSQSHFSDVRAHYTDKGLSCGNLRYEIHTAELCFVGLEQLRTKRKTNINTKFSNYLPLTKCRGHQHYKLEAAALTCFFRGKPENCARLNIICSVLQHLDYSHLEILRFNYSLKNMLFYLLSAFSIATFGSFATGESTLPITTCKRNSVDYSACLTHFLKETWSQFIPGLPELNFPTLDPLNYEHGAAEFKSGEIDAKVVLSNTTATGLSKVRFYDVRTYFHDDKFRLEIDIQISNLYVKGDVKIDGTVGIFKIINDGHFNSTIGDIKGTWDITGRVVNDTGIVENVRTFPSIGKFNIYFDNLFQGNKELNNLAVIFINEFWPPLYRVMLPIVANIWDPWLADIINKIFSKVPFSKMFP